MDSYEHEYLEKHEAQTKLAKFRAFRKVLQRRPWSFYPTAVLGQHRQTLPLSGWLCVNFGDSHSQQNAYWYDNALASYTEYLREVATPDQWKEFQDTLDEKAKADRDAINGGWLDSSTWDYDIIRPTKAHTFWKSFELDHVDLFHSLDNQEDYDISLAPRETYAPAFAATSI
jgi:hypothetical protein